MENIVSKNCGPATFFRDLLECLLIGEENEIGKHIFGLCFPMGPADTGRPPREPEGGEGDGKAGTAGEGTKASPQSALLSR